MRAAASLALALAAASASTPAAEASASLEAAIDQDPYDDEIYAVYGDLLQQQRDPRGELVALQTWARRDPARVTVLRDYFDRHPELLPRQLGGELSWRNGFVQRAEVPVDQVTTILAHPSSRFLAELVVRADHRLFAPRGTRPDDPPDLAPVIELLGSQHRPALRELELVVGPQARFCWIGNVDPLWAAMPNLRRLSLCGGIKLEQPIELPKLERLEVGSFRMQPGELRAIRERRWPALTHFTTSPGVCTYVALDELGALIGSGSMPALRSLAIRNTYHIERVLGPLMRSPLLSQLHVLDLRNTKLTDAHAAIMVSQAAAFRGLHRLDVSRNQLTRRAVRRLRAIAAHVIADDQSSKPIGLLSD